MLVVIGLLQPAHDLENRTLDFSGDYCRIASDSSWAPKSVVRRAVNVRFTDDPSTVVTATEL